MTGAWRVLGMMWVLGGLQTGEACGEVNTILLNGKGMARVKKAMAEGDTTLKPAVDALARNADGLLDQGPWTVTSGKLPPSGDPHDYMSVGPYWWPDPSKPDGLPYIRKDGQVNPERREYDNVGLDLTAENSLTLALAWYYTGEEKYARKAVELLRTWYLNPKTRMNPHLEFGQAIPGRTKGRDIGIIDTHSLIEAVDAALILEESELWTEEDAKGLRSWFGEYLTWLRESKHGRSEGQRRNNHGTWYDVQVVCYALYTGRKELARIVLEKKSKVRVDHQIDPEGKQMEELSRTRSWDYSLFNLKAFFELARMGEHAGVDLWNYRAEDGSGVRPALDWLIPYATKEKKWDYPQISETGWDYLGGYLRRAAVAYGEHRYEKKLKVVLSTEELERSEFQLRYPANLK